MNQRLITCFGLLLACLLTACDENDHTQAVASFPTRLPALAIGCFAIEPDTTVDRIWHNALSSLGLFQADSVAISPDRPHMRRLRASNVPDSNTLMFWVADSLSDTVRWVTTDGLTTMTLVLVPLDNGLAGEVWTHGDLEPRGARIGLVRVARRACDERLN